MASLARCEAARHDIIKLQYGTPEPGTSSKIFFPGDRLRSYLTEGKIRAILSCQCGRCREDLDLFDNRIDQLENYVDSITGGPGNLGKPSYSLFGLLIYARHPSFIIGFLSYDYIHDNAMASKSNFTVDNLKKYTNFKKQSLNNDFDTFQHDFSKEFASFSIPYMDSGMFSKYDSSVILPFIDEQEIGKRINTEGRWTSEGANGRVFSFKIYDEYHKFPHAKQVRHFARKEIFTPELRAYLEARNLQSAQRFRDDHIVKLIKAYEQNETINLIFPLAKTNLDHLLRDTKFEYGKKRGGSIEDCDAWEQLLGVAKAIRKIGGYERKQNDDNGSRLTPAMSKRLCIHFDLKPDNILVEHGGNWVITDFGQAATAYARDDGTPYVRNRSGTDAYAPPEVEYNPMKASRAYDIWSFGCIILEVTAFVVLGYAGLTGCDEPGDSFTGLDHARREKSSSSNHGQDERFFYRASSGGEYVVKKNICEFMEFLRSRASGSLSSSERSKQFLSSILELVDRMLKPNVSDRVDIKEVVAELSLAIKQASTNVYIANVATMLPEADETALGGPRLNNIRLRCLGEMGSIANENYYNMEAFENEGGNIRLLLLSVGGAPSDGSPHSYPGNNINFPKKITKLIPRYAFWKSQSDPIWIQISYLSNDLPMMIPMTKFAFPGKADLQEPRIVQSVLTSQQIEASFSLGYVKITRDVSRFGKFLNITNRTFKSTRAENEAEDFLKYLEFESATLQIWVEQPGPNRGRGIRPAPVHTNSTERKAREYQSGYQSLPISRIAIYFHDRGIICTIRMDVNWVLGSKKSETGEIVYFEPNDRTRDASFVASWIRPSEGELNSGGKYPAGIPLDPKVLEDYEDNDRFEAECFELKFRDASDQRRFRRMYMKVKEKWDIQRKELEKTQEHMPVNRKAPRSRTDQDLFSMPKKKASLTSSSSRTLADSIVWN